METFVPRFGGSQMLSPASAGRWHGKKEGPLAIVRRNRRAAERFPLTMKVAYSFFRGRERYVLLRGEGQTIDMSRTGISLRTEQACPTGAVAELLVEWPTPRADSERLQLRVFGSVVRCDERATAIRFFRHEFQAQAAADSGFVESAGIDAGGAADDGV
jgi:hypothetical protein